MVHRFNHHNGTLVGNIKMLELRLWKACEDMKTLFEMNQGFLAGDYSIHPAHGRPLYNESDGISQGLLEMNEYGMFTIQGQPKLTEAPQAPHQLHEPEKVQPSETEAGCRCCAAGRCYTDCSLWSQKRQLPFVQFCLPVDRAGTATVEQAFRFVQALCEDHSVHTMVSWPKNLKVSGQDAKTLPVRWTQADLTEAKKYIPQDDLDEDMHFKSTMYTSCAHEIRVGYTKGGLKQARWSNAKDFWSEVNDYHLMRPRVPEFFLGKDSSTIVIGVNSTYFSGKNEMDDIESSMLRVARDVGMKKTFPVKAAIPELAASSRADSKRPEGSGEGAEEVDAQLVDVAMRVFNSIMKGEE